MARADDIPQGMKEGKGRDHQRSTKSCNESETPGEAHDVRGSNSRTVIIVSERQAGIDVRRIKAR